MKAIPDTEDTESQGPEYIEWLGYLKNRQHISDIILECTKKKVKRDEIKVLPDLEKGPNYLGLVRALYILGVLF